MLLEVFQEHNSEYRELMNKEYAEGTVLRYERTARYLKEFISEQYKLADIPLKMRISSWLSDSKIKN